MVCVHECVNVSPPPNYRRSSTVAEYTSSYAIVLFAIVEVDIFQYIFGYSLTVLYILYILYIPYIFIGGESRDYSYSPS